MFITLKLLAIFILMSQRDIFSLLFDLLAGIAIFIFCKHHKEIFLLRYLIYLQLYFFLFFFFISAESITSGLSWAVVADQVGTRSEKQCRTKWLNYLNWKQQGGADWTREDDNLLIERWDQDFSAFLIILLLQNLDFGCIALKFNSFILLRSINVHSFLSLLIECFYSNNLCVFPQSVWYECCQ